MSSTPLTESSAQLGAHRGGYRERAAYEHVFTTIKLNITFTVEEIVVVGSIAFARTGSKGTVTVLAAGTTVPEENRELFVFQKEDGVWKIARYMFNKTS